MNAALARFNAAAKMGRPEPFQEEAADRAREIFVAALESESAADWARAAAELGGDATDTPLRMISSAIIPLGYTYRKRITEAVSDVLREKTANWHAQLMEMRDAARKSAQPGEDPVITYLRALDEIDGLLEDDDGDDGLDYLHRALVGPQVESAEIQAKRRELVALREAALASGKLQALALVGNAEVYTL